MDVIYFHFFTFLPSSFSPSLTCPSTARSSSKTSRVIIHYYYSCCRELKKERKAGGFGQGIVKMKWM